MTVSLNLELAFKSEKHGKILDMVRERYQLSYDDMSKRWPAWRKILKESESVFDIEEIKRQNKSRSDNDMEIKVPFTWAMQQTAVMYLTSVFLARNPVFQYTARHGEGQDNVIALESLIDYQVNVGEMIPALYSWLNDSVQYGLGVVGEYWTEETARVRRRVEKPVTIMGIPILGKTKIVEEFAELVGYQGNKLYAVRPFDFFPDTRVPIRDLQRGEFCGILTEFGYHEIMAKKDQQEYFNLDVLKQAAKAGGGKSSYMRERHITREDSDIPNSDGGGKRSAQISDFLEILEMYVRIIPKDWGLGESTYPEMWVFTIANDYVVIGCRPSGMMHDRFPFHPLEYEINGHNVHARGMNEIVKPLNDVMSWLFNSHIYNVRKTINNELVVDPSRINMLDFKKSGPGRILRLTANAYGTPPSQAIHQLNMNDVTRGNLNDMLQVKNLMQMILGINDSLMGSLGGTNRKTATEVRSSTSFGINRLKTTAEYFSATGFQSLSRNLVASTQQLYSGDRKYKIAGNQLTGDNLVTVVPESIAGFYDFVPVDGTLPVDRMMQANMFKELLFGMGKLAPQMLQQYDMGKLYEYILSLNGVKNIDSFKITVMPPVGVGASGMMGGVPQASAGANPSETLPTAGSPQDVQ